MYSKEEAKAKREAFWDSFKRYSADRRRKKGLSPEWMLTRTGIKALNLRFHVDRELAQVGIDLETRNMDKRLELYEKLEAVKKILEEAMGEAMKWELEYIRENGKSVSRIYLEICDVDIYRQESWKRTQAFMFEKMMRLEAFYKEYRDYFKFG